MLDVTHRLPAAICPWCRTPFDAATGALGRAHPKVGDLSVCIRCGGLIEFGIGLVPQRASEAILAAEPPETRALIRKMQLGVAALDAPKKSH